MNTNITREPRVKKLIFISLVFLSILGVVGGEYFYVRNVHQQHPPLAITQPKKIPTTQSTVTPDAIMQSTIMPDWHLVFDDEFSGASLDTTKWNIEDMSSDGYHNCCLNYGIQYYTPEALSIQQGSLQITTQAQSMNGYSYTSGAITTEGKFSFLYGQVDIRAKLPQTQGTWPTFWLLPIHTVGTAPFEIDMAEMIGRIPNTVYMVNHAKGQTDYLAFKGSDFSENYHLFSLVWTSQTITWYIDGIDCFESQLDVSNQPMYLIINSALGGGWAGPPDTSTVLPQYMDIDFVRIYQP